MSMGIGQPQSLNSLHAINPYKPNEVCLLNLQYDQIYNCLIFSNSQYQAAIQAVTTVLEEYDSYVKYIFNVVLNTNSIFI